MTFVYVFVAGETVAPFARPIISITTIRNRQETGKRNDKMEEEEKKLKFVDNNQKSITNNIDKNLIRFVEKQTQTLLFYLFFYCTFSKRNSFSSTVNLRTAFSQPPNERVM